MTDQTPRTDAGRTLLQWFTANGYVSTPLPAILAIEAEAAAQARTEALDVAAERVRALVRYQFVAANGEFISLDDLWAILAGETE